MILFKKVRFCIKNGISNHLAVFASKFDPIEHVDQHGGVAREDGKMSLHFCFAAFIIVFTTLYGIFGIELEHRGRVQFEQLPTSPYVFTHQFVPRSVWAQLDVGIITDFVTAVLVYPILILNPSVRKRFQFSTDGNTVFIGSKGKC